MTDFLSMLLARNTSMETGNDFLHPRLRSRFEQVPADEQMDKIDSNLDGEQHDPAGALLSSFTVQAPAIDKRREPDLQNEAISRPGPLNAPSPVWRELLPAPNRIIAADPQPSRAGAQPEAHPSEPARHLISHLEQHQPQQIRQSILHQGPDVPASLPVGRKPRTEHTEVDPPSPVDRREVERFSPLAPLPGPIQQPSRQSGALFNPPVSETVESTQPIIHVSIGRVEVRAVQQNIAPVAGTGRKATTVMSLEEHLRRRSGGEA